MQWRSTASAHLVAIASDLCTGSGTDAQGGAPMDKRRRELESEGRDSSGIEVCAHASLAEIITRRHARLGQCRGS